jgi:hypothetical protein
MFCFTLLQDLLKQTIEINRKTLQNKTIQTLKFTHRLPYTIDKPQQ